MKHKIEVNRTAHYYHQPSTKQAKGIILAIHGYGQLAENFITEFSLLSEIGFHIYAPEALSKFYNKHGEPVANWMTSHERESEIFDYVFYLEKIVQKIRDDNPGLPIHLIGFSQGVSTLLRWYSTSQLLAHSVHLVAGSIPEELHKSDYPSLKAIAYYYYHGTNDRLVTETQVASYLAKLKEIGIDFSFTRFEGRHEIPDELLTLFKSL